MNDEICQVKMRDGNPCGRRSYKGKKKCILHLEEKSNEEAEIFKIFFWNELKRMENDNNIKSLDFTDFVFPNTIHFENHLFEKLVIFKGAVFNAKAIFSEVQFNADAIFSGAQFKTDAIFSEVQFKSKVDFSKAKFDNSAHFFKAHFNNEAVFSEAQFNNFTGFQYAIFKNLAHFLLAKFFKMADFSSAKFNNEAIFSGAQFNEETYFVEVQFDNKAYFSDAQFNNEAVFSRAQFNNEAVFFEVKFNNVVHFIGTVFNKLAYFSDARFNDKTDFSAAKFRDETNFSETDFMKDLSFINTEFHIGNECFINFQYSKFHKQNDVRFQEVDLRNVSFLNTDITDVEFLDEKWFKKNGRLIVADEIWVGEEDSGVTYGAVAQLYRRLRRNYETKYKFAEAGDFFIGEMEMRRLDVNTRFMNGKVRKMILWFKRNCSLLGIYKLLSLYGESYIRPAFFAFIVIISYPTLMHWLFNASLVEQSDDFLYTYLRKSTASFFQMDSTYVGERLIGIPILGLLFIALKRKFERKK